MATGFYAVQAEGRTVLLCLAMEAFSRATVDFYTLVAGRVPDERRVGIPQPRQRSLASTEEAGEAQDSHGVVQSLGLPQGPWAVLLQEVYMWNHLSLVLCGRTPGGRNLHKADCHSQV